jgi:hypothetical protein
VQRVVLQCPPREDKPDTETTSDRFAVRLTHTEHDIDNKSEYEQESDFPLLVLTILVPLDVAYELGG